VFVLVIESSIIDVERSPSAVRQSRAFQEGVTKWEFGNEEKFGNEENWKLGNEKITPRDFVVAFPL